MPQGKYFRMGYGIVLALLIVYLASKVPFLFRPIVVIMQTLFLPLFVSGVLYYVLRPIVRFLVRRGLSKRLAILAVYLLLFGFVALLVTLIGPSIVQQFRSLISNTPFLIRAAQDQITRLEQNEWIAQYLEQNDIQWTSSIGDYLNQATSVTLSSVQTLLGFLTKFLILLSTVPFILFYMLSEGEKLPQIILRILPDEHDEDGLRILGEMDNALSAYLQGKVLISLCLGIMVAFGYWIIGLPYALLLATCITVLTLIPYVGIYLGTAPALIVAFIISPGMLIKTLIVVVLSQQIESNLFAPYIMGKKLKIHPLTIILMLLVAGSFGGLLGVFLAVPIYAIVKVIVVYLYQLYRLRNDRLRLLTINGQEPDDPDRKEK